MKLGQLSLVTLVLLLSSAAWAGSLRCESKVISIGDSQYKFLKLCGEPNFVKKRVVYQTQSIASKHVDKGTYHSHDEQHPSAKQLDNNYVAGYRNTNNAKRVGHNEVEHRHTQEQQIEIEKWTYDFGSNRLLQEVRFVDGVAVKISSRGYGFSRN
jgi:hypothetical protein